MTSLRATATLAGLLLLAGLIYAASCAWWPFARCRVCEGSGKSSPKRNRRIFRDCWWCKGSGRRLRIGRRAWNFVQRRRKAAQ